MWNQSSNRLQMLCRSKAEAISVMTVETRAKRSRHRDLVVGYDSEGDITMLQRRTSCIDAVHQNEE
jgi:hypothetical protein